MTTQHPAIMNRKRSRLAPDSDDEDAQQRREPSPALPTFSDTLKRSKTQCELDDLDMIGIEKAWHIDVDAILASETLATAPGSMLAVHDNWGRYGKDESIVVICVQGNMHLHYDLLCESLPSLYTLSPSLQALVLCHDPSTHTLSTTAPFSLPLIQAVAPLQNHFVRLGLLHPLGGGKLPLDALVVLDWKGRRRLVLPFGWGAGKHVGTPAGGSIQTQLVKLLMHCVDTLEQERDQT
ncbi:hypothetical protein P153DRAFT_281012 [Dothidotthia symphoricarpi CBS 119687]|uniref:Uncharacterized protein n=1 Tax=Dothidotthia symphoricarpi CBS 119687 TaxID=1392245 RepID=A0A6A6AQW7_9PLEO|nr:uncharacterized protein P153DRAFT_281012 [Dothidotthia symphoricarpi CBS 119687]KAF2133936.1 hypothetical protein P153DRAFT_281012 [Dothidotthia symphoricarpi CBS 119687]